MTSPTRDELLQRITVDPNVCFGKPCIRGMRIWVALILEYLAYGRSEKQILEEFAGLEPLDIQAALAYAVTTEKFA
jgi:uncharacterized protein (DUF433 family)